MISAVYGLNVINYHKAIKVVTRMLYDISISNFRPQFFLIALLSTAKSLGWWKEMSALSYTDKAVCLKLIWATITKSYPEVFDSSNARVISGSSGSACTSRLRLSGTAVNLVCLMVQQLSTPFELCEYLLLTRNMSLSLLVVGPWHHITKKNHRKDEGVGRCYDETVGMTWFWL